MGKSQSRGLAITATVLAVLVGLAFVAAGGMILSGSEDVVKSFKNFGYPVWFMYLTGVIEVLSGVALMVPAVRFYGAVLLSCTMVGAIVSHARVGDPAGELIPGGVLLMLCSLLACYACPFCGKQPAEDEIGERGA